MDKYMFDSKARRVATSLGFTVINTFYKESGDEWITIRCQHSPPHTYSIHASNLRGRRIHKCVRGLKPKDREFIEKRGYEILDDSLSPNQITVKHLKCGRSHVTTRELLLHEDLSCNSSVCRADYKQVCSNCGELHYKYHFTNRATPKNGKRGTVCSVCKRLRSTQKMARALDKEYSTLASPLKPVGITLIKIDIWDNTRRCNVCKKIKVFGDFGRASKYGVRRVCKQCEFSVKEGFYICKKCQQLRERSLFVHTNYPCSICTPDVNEKFRSMMREHVRRLAISPVPYNNSVYVPLFESCGIKCRASAEGFLQVKCRLTGCNSFFTPNRRQVQQKKEELLGRLDHTGKTIRQPLYCSEECKKECREFGKSAELLMKEDQILAGNFEEAKPSREQQKAWAEEVKARAEFKCEICHSTNLPLIAHHIDPVVSNPIESADYDNGVCLCQECNTKVHKLPKCSYSELRQCRK